MHTEVKHPCIEHKMALLRDRATAHKEFRELASEITMFLCYEALQELPMLDTRVDTPLAPMTCRKIASDILVVPVLRAGIGMLTGVLNLLPNARVGFVGMYRDEVTKLPVEYYRKFPKDLREPQCLVIDPMLATGGSTAAVLAMLKRHGYRRITVVCIITCPEGLAAVESAHPDVPIFAAAVDERLNDDKFILPGLGDAGDRLFGTK